MTPTPLDLVLVAFLNGLSVVALWTLKRERDAANARYRLLQGMYENMVATVAIWQERAHGLYVRLDQHGLLTEAERLARGLGL